MRISKIMTVFFTLITAIIIPLDYMVATKAVTSVNSIASVLNEAKSLETNVIEVSSIESTKKETNNLRGTVTSRSGARKKINTTSEVIVATQDANIQTEEEPAQETTVVPEVAEKTEEEVVVEAVQEKPSFGGVELSYSSVYNISSSRLTKSKGVTYYNGHKETYYSQRVLPGKGLKALNSNGRHVADDGTVRDGDGYIAVACNYLPKGSEIMTSLGPGKVYDTGGMTGKWIDIYVNW